MPGLAGLDPVTLAVFAGLLALSVVATTIALVKAVQILALGVGGRRRGERILDDWHAGRTEQALTQARGGRGAAARVVAATLTALRQRPADSAFAEEVGRRVALDELARLSAWMRGLEAVVQAAPMLGLLGTVVGMIDAFGALSATQGAADPALLAGGIWTALTTTAAGLAIALVFYFIAILLEGRIEAERQTMEALLSTALHGGLAPSRAG
jgi:biopolymer transport protein ExbB